MEIRRYGKTTGAVLEALGKAMANPGSQYVVGDIDLATGCPSTATYNKIVMSAAQELIARLCLQDIKVFKSAGSIVILSEYMGALATDSGKAYKIKLEEIK